MTPRSFTINGEFENLALPRHRDTEGLLLWNTSVQPHINKFNGHFPAQQPFFISKDSWKKLWLGNGFVPASEKVYLILFCAAYDSANQSVYYRIRLITILKSDLANAQTATPQPLKVNVKVYTSPIAYTVPRPEGGDCLEWLDIDNPLQKAKVDQINLDVENWKSKIRTSFPGLLTHNEPVYIGDMVGAKRIRNILTFRYRTVGGITISPALYSNAEINKPFIAFQINAEGGTVSETGEDILKCPPHSTNPCTAQQ
ncbi:MAG: hypothetical protein U0X91_13255 [Spirosomataceae bacterium]